ncbi:MAG: 2-C-methyl-D-erythritol 4-phosphate cytidylyltransferase [Candidatus Tectimicrobiota bacterium]
MTDNATFAEKDQGMKAPGNNGRVAALIPAAGTGQRMGSMTPKQFLCLKGREILARTLDVFEACKMIDEIWVVAAADYCRICRELLIERYGFRKIRGIVAGGETRQESVWCGLQHITEACDLIVVHDGVRPFVTESLLQQTLAVARQYGAAITAIPLKDTLKRVSESGEVEATVARERLWRIQTPQAFQRSVLYAAFQQARQQGLEATDESGLVEALAYPVKIVPGLEQNVKMTTPDDLIFGEAYLHASF